MQVGIHRTLAAGSGPLYFNLQQLAAIEENLLKVSKDKDKKLQNYEKLRTVGKVSSDSKQGQNRRLSF